MSEFLNMLASVEIPELLLCGVAVVIFDLFAIAILMAAGRESRLCQKRWQKISSGLVLRSKELQFPLEADEILLGRHLSADIRIPDPSVSRYHAVMTVTGGVWTITDLGAKGGTFVNDRRVQHAKLLPGDKIRLGNATLRLVRLKQDAA
ncbi:MAG: FHA domain-containing protein [Oscillospiraceae bacterium]|nr:FHA domain-containing protein [Ruminococcus sp.]MBQ7012788.1 FHA domain-containing protein [Oscillospiraceae bacterium]